MNSFLNKYIVSSLFVGIFVFGFMPVSSHAAVTDIFSNALFSNSEADGTRVLNTPEAQVTIPGTGVEAQGELPGASNTPTATLGNWISAVYQFGIGIAGILAVMMMMMGGLMWLLSAGSPEKISKGKEWITSAIVGLLLALFSYAILYTINPRIVENFGVDISGVGGVNDIGGTGAGSSLATEALRSVTGVADVIPPAEYSKSTLLNTLENYGRPIEAADIQKWQIDRDTFVDAVDKKRINILQTNTDLTSSSLQLAIPELGADITPIAETFSSQGYNIDAFQNGDTGMGAIWAWPQ